MTTAIFDAIYDDDAQQLRDILESNPEKANAFRTEDGETPLALACEYV